MALPPMMAPLIGLLALITVVVLAWFSIVPLLTIIFASLVIATSIGMSILMSQPFTGALVRLRANYLPKAVSLDNVLEDGASEGPTTGEAGATTRKISAYFLRQRRQGAKIGPVVSGIIPMLMRTKQLEGWAGIYKGSFPVALHLFLLALVTSLLFDVDGHSTVGAGGAYKAAPTGPGQYGLLGNLFFMAFMALASLPLNVLTYRAIVHPTVLPFRFSAIRDNLEELLSPAEIAQPWRLYMIPGLLPVTFAHISWIGLLTRPIRYILVPTLGGLADPEPASSDQTDYSGPNSSMKAVNPIALVIFLCWCLFSVVALSPMEVINIRLSTQRPERQQPLHLHYSRLQQQQNSGPASYSHQASVSVGSAQPDGFSDQPQRQSQSNKPLPSEPSKPDTTTADDNSAAPGRPSFAIEDEDEGEGDGAAERDPLTSHAQRQAHADAAARANDAQGRSPRQSGANGNSMGSMPYRAPYHPSHSEPPEPVIALRPVEEPPARPSSGAAGGPGIEDDSAAVVQRYEGFKDCVDKIIDEEGVEALYRGAWVTALGGLLGGLT